MLSAVPATAATPPEPAAAAAAAPDPAAGAGAGESAGAEVGPAVTGVELESMVSHVQDLLPDLSRSFVMVRLSGGWWSAGRDCDELFLW